MKWEIDFELTRLYKLLTERLMPRCMGQTLAPEEIECLSREISWEGEKIYVQVIKVLCRPYTDEHLRRYLKVHLSGAALLRRKVGELVAKTGEVCQQVFEAFEQTLDRVLESLGSLQEESFGDVHQLSDYKTKEDVMELLCCSESSFYRKKNKGNWKSKMFDGVERYLLSSLFDGDE